MMLSTIPFSGFCYSVHDQDLEAALEQMFWDDHGNTNEGLLERANDIISWGPVYEAYAKAYAENFGAEFEIFSLEFDELSSPREYNFLTDRIFVRVSLEDVQKLWERVDKNIFANICKELFTSRSGFSSSYDPYWEVWGPLEDWDHNEVGALMEAIACQEGWDENYSMERDRGNGEFDRWLYDAMKEPMRSRIFKVNDYLREKYGNRISNPHGLIGATQRSPDVRPASAGEAG